MQPQDESDKSEWPEENESDFRSSDSSSSMERAEENKIPKEPQVEYISPGVEVMKIDRNELEVSVNLDEVEEELKEAE